MGLVSTWLKTVGLEHAVPAFRSAGINSPSALAQLEMSEYEQLGISDWNDKRKLLYLIQRIQVAKDDSERHLNTAHSSEDDLDDEIEEEYSQDELETESYYSDTNHENEARNHHAPTQTAAAALAGWSAVNDEEVLHEDEISSQYSSNSTLPSPPALHNQDRYHNGHEFENNHEWEHHRHSNNNRITTTRQRDGERPSSRSMRLLKTASASSQESTDDFRYHQSSFENKDKDEEEFRHSNRRHNINKSSLSGRYHHHEYRDDGRNKEKSSSHKIRHFRHDNSTKSFDSNSSSHHNIHEEKDEYHYHHRDEEMRRKSQNLKPMNSKHQRQIKIHPEESFSPPNRDRKTIVSYDDDYDDPLDVEYDYDEFHNQSNIRHYHNQIRSNNRPNQTNNNENGAKSRHNLSSYGMQISSHEREYVNDNEYNDKRTMYDNTADYNDIVLDRQEQSPPRPPTRNSTRGMSQRLKEKNMRTKMERERSKEIVYSEDASLPDDYSRSSRKSSSSRTTKSSSREEYMSGGKGYVRHNKHEYGRGSDNFDETEYKDEYDTEIVASRQRKGRIRGNQESNLPDDFSRSTHKSSSSWASRSSARDNYGNKCHVSSKYEYERDHDFLQMDYKIENEREMEINQISKGRNIGRHKEKSFNEDTSLPDDSSRTSRKSISSRTSKSSSRDEYASAIYNKTKYNYKKDNFNEMEYAEDDRDIITSRSSKDTLSNMRKSARNAGISTSPITTSKAKDKTHHASISKSKAGSVGPAQEYDEDEVYEQMKNRYTEERVPPLIVHNSDVEEAYDDGPSNTFDPDLFSLGRSSNKSNSETNQLPSTIQAPKITSQRRRTQSKIQNPSISLRNGKKMLSSIPSEKVAPMSPLVEISSSNLQSLQLLKEGRKALFKNEDNIEEEEEENVYDKKRISRDKNRRQSSIGSGEYRSSSSSRERKERSSKSSRRLSAPISNSTHGALNNHEEKLLSNKDKMRPSLKGSRRTSTGSLSSQSTASRKSLGTHVSTSSTNKNTDSPRNTSNATSRTLLRPISKQAINPSIGKDSDNLDGQSLSKLKEQNQVYVHGLPKDDSWSAQVAQLREDMKDAYSDGGNQTSMEANKDEEEEMRIRVIVRKRPMSEKELNQADVDIIHPIDCSGFGRVVVYQAKTRVDLTKEVDTLKFSFDNVFCENSSNNQIYEGTIRNLIPGVFEGQWASIFAYGQTGSGKTFTMMGCSLTGSKGGSNNNKEMNKENQGLYYLAAQDVFHLAKMEQYKYLTVGVSLFEIYGGKLFDLLSKRKPVKCLEDHKGKVCFPGLSEHPISNPSELLQMIETGALNRSTGVTSANADSSRSHAVLMLCLRKKVGRNRNVEHGRLTFIDLAGSERGADTAKACRTTRLEGAEINTSLLALKEVIRALATGDSMTRIPFRGSKLTQVLKESFVGKNSRTVMVACVAPNMNNCDHTLNTLRYADRVKERDAETGKLSDKVLNASKIVRKISSARTASLLKRPSTAPATSLEKKLSMDRIDAASSTKKVPSTYDEVEWSSEDEQDDDSVVIDNERILTSDNISKGSTNRTRNGYEPSTNHKSKLKVASNTLINNHRTVMSKMLNTVKHEMTLVNGTDADRNTIEDYLTELENVLENNSLMITSLRESLLEYYAIRGEKGNESCDHLHSNHHIGDVIDDEGLLSDDTFEDLRD